MKQTVICDLDGVVYRGSEALPGAAAAVERLVASGFRIVFVTNNSSRTEIQVADKLEAVVGHRPDIDDIVTSARAALALVPEGASCLVVGGDGIREAIDSAGFSVTGSSDEADCVIVGLDRGFDYQRMDVASRAIRSGAVFVATNVDPTFPAEQSIMPGAGAIVAALQTASGVTPLVAGKPEKPIRDLIRSRGVEDAWVIGDRPDTDIAMAEAEDGWTSILVLTGVTPEGADTGGADHVVADLAAAVDLVIAGDNEQ
ncbi:MAG: HAD-IIA family hydrolase [Acidimicrobiia bacterium]